MAVAALSKASLETTLAAAAADDTLGPIAPSKKTADKIVFLIFIVPHSFPAADRPLLR